MSMRGGHRLANIAGGLLAAALGCCAQATARESATDRGTGEERLSVLVFSKTAGFRHDSIEAGQALMASLAAAHGFEVVISEDAQVFTAAQLDGLDAVVFLNTTGDVLDDAQQQAFEMWLRAGGGFVGVHAAADTEYDWPFYGGLLGGAWFHSHPAIQSAHVVVEHGDDAATRHLPAAFAFEEEWYNFRANPRPATTVLMTLDEGSYAPGTGAMGEDHPIGWKRDVDAGRSFYTGLGHREETYADDGFRKHLLGGVLWAAGDLLLSTGFEPAQRR
jgi:type 1 glutamine amidotransferase